MGENLPVRVVNRFFKKAIRSEVSGLIEELLLTERQNKLLELRYIKKYSPVKIAEMTNYDKNIIQLELKIVRRKMLKVLEEKLPEEELKQLNK